MNIIALYFTLSYFISFSEPVESWTISLSPKNNPIKPIDKLNSVFLIRSLLSLTVSLPLFQSYVPFNSNLRKFSFLDHNYLFSDRETFQLFEGEEKIFSNDSNCFNLKIKVKNESMLSINI